MFHVKNYKQLNILDPWAHLGPKRRNLLNGSWPGLFQQKILPELPVESLRRHYNDCNGRPTKELYAMMGMMILQQMHDYTDEQAVEQFCFNIQWHYALNITSFSDAASYISHKTLWTMRDHLSTDETYTEIFDSSLQTLATLINADLSKQRMDSVHIKSNMRNLGRIGLFVKTIKKFLVNLKRQHRGLFDQLDEQLTGRYLNKSQASVFAMVKPTDSTRTLDQLAGDVLTLTERFSSVSEVGNMQSFKLLALEQLKQKDMLPEEMLADSLYGSDSNCEAALQDHQVAVIAPAMPGNQKKFHLADFTLDEQGKILTCPQGAEPEKVKKTTSGYSVIPTRISVYLVDGRRRTARRSETNIGTGPGSRRPCRNSTGEPVANICAFVA